MHFNGIIASVVVKSVQSIGGRRWCEIKFSGYLLLLFISAIHVLIVIVYILNLQVLYKSLICVY